MLKVLRIEEQGNENGVVEVVFIDAEDTMTDTEIMKVYLSHERNIDIENDITAWTESSFTDTHNGKTFMFNSHAIAPLHFDKSMVP